MHVLENHQHRIDPRQRYKLRHESFHRLLAALLWRHFDHWVAAVIRQRQHFGKECGVLKRRKTLRQQGIEFIELCLRNIVVG
jgi:hypothetical protein